MLILKRIVRSRVAFWIYLLLLSPMEAKEAFHIAIADLSIPDEYDGEGSYYDYLWRCYQVPLDLNYCSEDELRRLGILSEEQLASFINYVAMYGLLCSIDELAAIPGWDESVIKKITPFIKVKDRRKKRKKRGGKPVLEQKISLEWVPKWHLHQEDDLGSPDVVSLTYQAQHKKGVSITMIAHKGIGESWRQSYIIGSGSFSGKKWIKKVVIGRFTIRIGQGVIMGGTSWSEDTFYGIKRRPFSLLSSRNRSRNNGLLGIGVLLHDKSSPFYFLGYGSFMPYFTSTKGKNSDFFISTIPASQSNSSYRNKKLWREKRGAIEPLAGFALIYQGQNKSWLGAHIVAHEYRDYLRKWHSLNRKIDDQHYASRHAYVGFFGYKKWSGGEAGGEVSYTGKNGLGMISGITLNQNSHVKHSLKVQYGSRQFYAFHSSEKKCTKPYHYKSIGVATMYLGKNQVITHSFRLYEGKNFRRKKMIKGASCTVGFTKEIARYKIRLCGKHKWQYSEESGLNVRFNMKLPAYQIRKDILGDTGLYLTGSKQSYVSHFFGGIGIGQIITYQKEKSLVKGSCILFRAPSKAGLYMYQPNLRFPYVKRYSGKGMSTTIMVRYTYNSTFCIEGLWQWCLFQQEKKNQVSRHVLAIRIVYLIKE